MINMLVDGAGENGEVYNVGTGTVTRIDELAQIVLDIFDSSMNIEYKDPMSGDIKHSSSCILKAKDIGFEPKVDFYKGLEEIMGK